MSSIATETILGVTLKPSIANMSELVPKENNVMMEVSRVDRFHKTGRG